MRYWKNSKNRIFFRQSWILSVLTIKESLGFHHLFQMNITNHWIFNATCSSQYTWLFCKILAKEFKEKLKNQKENTNPWSYFLKNRTETMSFTKFRIMELKNTIKIQFFLPYYHSWVRETAEQVPQLQILWYSLPLSTETDKKK